MPSLRSVAARAYRRLPPRMRSALWRRLLRPGFFDVLEQLDLLDTVAVRAEMARRYIRGEGIEIGAMHLPLPVPAGATVRYVDTVTREESIRRFPHLDAGAIVTPDYLEDGFELPSLAPASRDFVIANHVLEHSPDPVGTLLRWRRVLRPGGVIFLSVPIAEKCFDRGRPETSVEHLLEDYRLKRSGDQEKFREACRPHYREWLTISEPAILRGDGRPVPERSPEELERRVDELTEILHEIHFHTFSLRSFRDLLEAVGARVDASMRVGAVVRSVIEIVAVLRVDPPAAHDTRRRRPSARPAR
ncbi:MAG: class I SAM-dependent methyltransferase [Candidatus Rokuibacteriota bacterium]